MIQYQPFSKFSFFSILVDESLDVLNLFQVIKKLKNGYAVWIFVVSYCVSFKIILIQKCHTLVHYQDVFAAILAICDPETAM